MRPRHEVCKWPGSSGRSLSHSLPLLWNQSRGNVYFPVGRYPTCYRITCLHVANNLPKNVKVGCKGEKN